MKSPFIKLIAVLPPLALAMEFAHASNEPVASEKPAAAMKHTSPLFGHWSLCTQGPGRFFGMLTKPIASQRTSYEFDDSTVTIKISSFASSNCSGTALFDYEKTGAYEIGAENTKIKGSTNIDPEFANPARITVHDEGTAKFFTFQQLCKIADWNVNETVTSNASCDAKFYEELADSDIFEIRDSHLYFGHSKANDSVAKTGLIENFAYSIQ